MVKKIELVGLKQKITHQAPQEVNGHDGDSTKTRKIQIRKVVKSPPGQITDRTAIEEKLHKIHPKPTPRRKPKTNTRNEAKNNRQLSITYDKDFQAGINSLVGKIETNGLSISAPNKQNANLDIGVKSYQPESNTINMTPNIMVGTTINDNNEEKQLSPRLKFTLDESRQSIKSIKYNIQEIENLIKADENLQSHIVISANHVFDSLSK